MEFEWKIFPGFTSMMILNEIQQMMGKLQCEPENFTGRIIFMSMFNDIIWDAKGNYELCVNNSKTINEYSEIFLDHVYLGCTQRECQISNDIVANYRDMFESRFSAGAKEKLPTRASGKLDAETISCWSYDMEGHAKKCAEIFANWHTKQPQQLYTITTPCLAYHQFKEEEEEMGSVGELP